MNKRCSFPLQKVKEGMELEPNSLLASG